MTPSCDNVHRYILCPTIYNSILYLNSSPSPVLCVGVLTTPPSLSTAYGDVREKLDSLQTNFSDLKTHYEQLDLAMKDSDSKLEKYSSEHSRLLAENEQLKSTCEDFRRESESILQDYNVCAQRLKISQDETSRLSGQHQQVSSELSHQTDRVRLLEKMRADLEDKLVHMDQQVSEWEGTCVIIYYMNMTCQ